MQPVFAPWDSAFTRDAGDTPPVRSTFLLAGWEKKWRSERDQSVRRAKRAYGFVAAASSPFCFVFYACCAPLSTRVERGVKLSYKFVGILRMVELLWRFCFEGFWGCEVCEWIGVSRVLEECWLGEYGTTECVVRFKVFRSGDFDFGRWREKRKVKRDLKA